MPDMGTGVAAAKKLFNNVTQGAPGAASPTSTPTTPVTGGAGVPASVPSGQGGIGSDAVAGGGADVSVMDMGGGGGGIGSAAGGCGGRPALGALSSHTLHRHRAARRG